MMLAEQKRVREEIESRQTFSYQYKRFWVLMRFDKKCFCCCRPKRTREDFLFTNAKKKMSEELDVLEIIKKLRQKYQQAESELGAVTRDQDDVRLELTDTIRDQEKDLDFMNAIVGMMLKEGEMYRLKEKIEYDFESGKWKVPPFLIKNKEVAFPRIRNAMNLVRDEMDQREVVIADTGEVLSQGSFGSGMRKGRN